MTHDKAKQFLDGYHEVSKQLGLECVEGLSPHLRAASLWRQSQARELVSRCLLTEDSRNIVHLIAQLAIVMKMAGQRTATAVLHNLGSTLAEYIDEFGSL